MIESATQFHITKKGAIEPCGTSVRACPLGGQYFDSEDDAKAKADFQREFKALQLVPTSEGNEVEIKDKFGQKKTVVVNRQR